MQPTKAGCFVFNHMTPFNGTPHARLMVGSIRKHMPDVHIMQISDKSAATVAGVDEVFKGDFEYDMYTYPRTWAQMLCAVMEVGRQEIICCDADMFFGGNVLEVLDGDFDIAICRRPPDWSDGTSVMYRLMHPYNIGFMVIKELGVLKYCRDLVYGDLFHDRAWALMQHAVGLVVNSGEVRVRFLDYGVYNYTPNGLDDFDPSVKVWHFKGDRKEWMPDWVERHGGERAA